MNDLNAAAAWPDHAGDNISEDVYGRILYAGGGLTADTSPILLLIPDPACPDAERSFFFAAGCWKNSRTPIKDNIAEHRTTHYISDVWLWRAAHGRELKEKREEKLHGSYRWCRLTKREKN